MKTSTDRILTTHVGSLPRPTDMLAMMEARESGAPYDPEALSERISTAIRDVVKTQVEAGIDSVNDGEQSKISYAFYVRHRLSGVSSVRGNADTVPRSAVHRDLIEHPDFMERLKRAGESATAWFARAAVPVCTGPLSYGDRKPLEIDIANLRAAVDEAGAAEAFMNAASPGVLTKFVPDTYYKDEDAYVVALAEAMKSEYEAIHRAGFILQIDAPDLGSARHNQYQDLSDREFLRIADRNVEALNHATAEIPPEAMRLHICWGNYEGPHTYDIPLATVFEVCMKARPAALLFEGANPRHAHEWEDIQNAKIPDEKILVPGVVDTTTNFVEHPTLIAQRLCNYANIVGRERVIAGTDCGFASFAGPHNPVVPSVVWAKFAAMKEGASIATERLWRRAARVRR
jgi:5-methyltetrahydropteroyltriglutamate--homocysteine methyltransferase